MAAFVCPGHPLLDATLDLTPEVNRDLLKRGAVLVDDKDFGVTPRVLCILEHGIQDASLLPTGERRTRVAPDALCRARCDGQGRPSPLRAVAWTIGR